MMNPHSEIYAIRPRGAALNAACQWILKHKRLAWRLVVLPSLFEAITLLVMTIVFEIKGNVIGFVPLIVILLNSEFPYMMMNVVENAEDYDYPNRLPRMGELKSLWWKNFKATIVISLLGMLMMFLTTITIFGPMLITIIIPFVLAIRMREERGYLSCFTQAFRLAFTNFGTFIITVLGVSLIITSLVFVPFSLAGAVLYALQTFINQDTLTELNTFLHTNIETLIVTFVLLIGATLAINTVLIIYNFFYGHCKESNDHPVLISKMEEL